MSERLTFGYGRRGGRMDAPAIGSPSVDSSDAPEATASVVHRARTRDWAYTLLFWFTVFLFLRPQNSFALLQALHPTELCAIGATIALVMSRISRGQPVTRITPELVGIVAFGAVMLATAPFSVWPGGVIGEFRNGFVKVMIVYVLIVNTVNTPKRLEAITWLLVAACGYIGFRAVLDYVRGVNLIENGRVQGALTTIFQNPNDMALNMVALLPLAIFFAMRRTKTSHRLFALACTVVMLGAIVASHSRSGTVGLAAMMFVLAAFAVRRRPGAVAAGALALVISLPFLPASYWERLQSITDASKDETGSREARETLFRESWRAFVENPLTGVGAGQFVNWDPEGREVPWRESHDVFLQVASEMGIAGFAVFMFLIARWGLSVRDIRIMLRRERGAARRRHRAGPGGQGSRAAPVATLTPDERELFDAHSAAMAASLVGWIVCAFFASVAYSWTFYYLLALAAVPRDLLAARLRAPADARASTERPGPWLEAVRA
ncbi:MAG TPA: O-antigen ligase family protein [Vicinamibacterales bacterium]|nr:O-antigen ligase family protein [Vicinamibacterales bacterium]